jgi:hypothetical protein
MGSSLKVLHPSMRIYCEMQNICGGKFVIATTELWYIHWPTTDKRPYLRDCAENQLLICHLYRNVHKM